jgi:alcohol dehydrogenase, propanol-preferring
MKAMILPRITNLLDNPTPLDLVDYPRPIAGRHEILIKVFACAVCHTELDEIEGRTPPPILPVIPGHQVVGLVEQNGEGSDRFKVGERVGVAWIFSACGECEYCRSGKENLCVRFRATGRDANGGYAEWMVVPQDFAYPIPSLFTNSEAAPLLCAGAVGYRSLRLANLEDGNILGLTGFGGSGHLVLKMAQYRFPKSQVFVFARNEKERAFALELGANWAEDSGETPPELCDSIIDTTPAWKPIVEALRCLKPGGRLVINAIRKEEADKKALLEMDYSTHLWMEKEIKSVANVTRRDVSEFLAMAAEIPIKPDFQEYSLEDANRALLELKERKIRGSKVLMMR